MPPSRLMPSLVPAGLHSTLMHPTKKFARLGHISTRPCGSGCRRMAAMSTAVRDRIDAKHAGVEIGAEPKSQPRDIHRCRRGCGLSRVTDQIPTPRGSAPVPGAVRTQRAAGYTAAVSTAMVGAEGASLDRSVATCMESEAAARTVVCG
jgi:hypothetical protein